LLSLQNSQAGVFCHPLQKNGIATVNQSLRTQRVGGRAHTNPSLSELLGTGNQMFGAVVQVQLETGWQLP
jgi:hypothetical protein